ncbi:MAG: protein kinase domain-containing protein [Acidobacteriota bacterium]
MPEASNPIARLNAALEGRYRIERELGAGGMATVYLAEDLRHHRLVALKVLKPDVAAILGADRFLAEVRTTANLQHPHILPLHDSGDAGGVLYYTMPFVEGETLRQRLDRETRLSEDEAVRIATDVADALQTAHERGVVHRDIKPSNILLNRGRAVVADFGIARATGTSDATQLTQAGVTLGTPGYMSPEQAQGDPDVDHRSDIYSLGCVLFEMLAGEPPYRGRTLMEVLGKQATEPVPSVRAVRRDVSTVIDRAVSTALARAPAQRFETTAALSAALATRHAERRRRAPATNTLGVLPFGNPSADPDHAYFSDGLTDEVIADLSRISALRVISRNSAMALKGTTKDTPTLARELGVTHVVTGTVRRSGQSLRITVELVDATTDTTMWTEKFSGSMDDVFGIQEEISRQIAAALKVRLTATEERGVAERPIDDPVAYDCYLRASQLMYSWTPESQRRAERLVDEAVAIVGEVPLLLAMKGQLHWNLVNTNAAPADAGLPRAEEFTDRALARDPDLHLAIFVRGLVAATRGRPEEGLVDLYRAHDQRPGDSNVLVELVRFSEAAGLDCRRHLDRAIEIDPLSPQANLLVALYCWLYGPREEAVRPARRAMELAPDPSMLHIGAAWTLLAAGRGTDASAILDRAGREAGTGGVRALARFLKGAVEGDADGALEVGTAEMERAITNEFFCRMMADGYALLGRTDDAVRALRNAVQLGFINYPSLTADSTPLATLRTSTEFQALLAEVKPRWERVVAWERARG